MQFPQAANDVFPSRRDAHLEMESGVVVMFPNFDMAADTTN